MVTGKQTGYEKCDALGVNGFLCAAKGIHFKTSRQSSHHFSITGKYVFHPYIWGFSPSLSLKPEGNLSQFATSWSPVFREKTSPTRCAQKAWRCAGSGGPKPGDRGARRRCRRLRYSPYTNMEPRKGGEVGPKMSKSGSLFGGST